MRTLLILSFIIVATASMAQQIFPADRIGLPQRQSMMNAKKLQDSVPEKKWSISKYVGISSSFGVFNGGSATVLAVPIGVQLNRRLNDNWSAFAGLSVAPAYVNFNQSFLTTNKYGQQTNFLRSNRLDVYSRAELGLMYTNDKKTFSISGSFGIERNNSPFMPMSQLGAIRPTNFGVPAKF